MTTPGTVQQLNLKANRRPDRQGRDIGRAELGPEDLRGIMKMNGVPMVATIIIPQPGANHIEIVDEVYSRLEFIKKDLPDDVEVRDRVRQYQIHPFLDHRGKKYHLPGFLSGGGYNFCISRDWRTTIIPILVIPVSLVGSFFIMYLAGFTINVLTLCWPLFFPSVWWSMMPL
jgi:multidrug efflux pump